LKIVYVLLSPTFGMHQYTADMANRTVENRSVELVTTTTYPRDRYSPAVRVHTPMTSHGTGFAAEGMDAAAYSRAWAAIGQGAGSRDQGTARIVDRQSSIVHFTGVHLWNVPLVWALRRQGIAVIHTLHDLQPHGGVRRAGLIRLWNRLIIGSGAQIVVHGRRYREELIAGGVPTARVTYLPLLHGFWGAGRMSVIPNPQHRAGAVTASPIANPPVVLFFGRVEAYKGVDVLLGAWERVQCDLPGARLVIAGQAAPGMALPALPTEAEWRDRRIEDGEAIELFRSASLLVLPYRDATQSALVAAAYAFGLPVIVTETGALPEYVVAGNTGWVVPPGDAGALADALCAALVDPGRLRAMGQAGRAWYEEQRKLEKAALAAMYAEVPKRNR
jgi:glycosyltransferase involved in cell wall biosynthesis